MRCSLIAIILLFIGCQSPLDEVLSRNEKLYGQNFNGLIFDSAYSDGSRVFHFDYTMDKPRNEYTGDGAEFTKRLFIRMMERDIEKSENVSVANPDFYILNKEGLDVVFTYYSFGRKFEIGEIRYKNIGKKGKGFVLNTTKSEWDESVELFMEKVL